MKFWRTARDIVRSLLLILAVSIVVVPGENDRAALLRWLWNVVRPVLVVCAAVALIRWAL